MAFGNFYPSPKASPMSLLLALPLALALLASAIPLALPKPSSITTISIPPGGRFSDSPELQSRTSTLVFSMPYLNSFALWDAAEDSSS
jgi:hypothetical protein